MTAVVDVVTILIAVLCATVGALMSRLYLSHRTGKMSLIAAAGTVTLLAGVMANHVTFAWGDDSLHPGSVVILVGLMLMLVSLLQVMEIGLFRDWTPAPTGAEARQTDIADQLADIAVAVAALEARGQADDERREAE